MTWLGTIPAMRHERHLDGRVVRCFGVRPASFNALLADALGRNPGGEALVCGTMRLDYRRLDAIAGSAAGGLARLGIGKGDRVALLIANSAEFVIALLAIVRIGAIAVPLNVREGTRELAYVLADCGAVALIHDATLASSIPPAFATPALATRVTVGGARHGAGALAWEDLLGGAAIEPCPVGEEDIAAILYTSGTTGRPKGAMITHLGLVHAAMIYEACMDLGPVDRSIATVPLSHVTGLTAGIAAMLRAGGTLVVMPQFRADAFLALAAAERMTHTVMVPAMYNLCLLSPAFGTADLSKWRIGGYGGAPMPAVTIERLAQRLPRLQLFNAYGSTETTGPVVLMPPSETARRATAVGMATPPAEILVMDENGCEAPTGESGEIWLKAPNVVAGYWGNPEASAESIVAGYWRSGDIGRIDGDGFLTLLDRAKDLVNRGGYKVYSVEVENVIAAHPSVVEAAVVARPCPVLGERVHAFVSARDGFADADAIRVHAAQALADYKVPEAITFLADPLPRNANGKILKRELRARLG
ncbi:MAG: AMP-binding protein [Hyphomicrobiaceae bacterium]|nr:AMP-binding protein [Hyphomicrobiaceae bacterium]